VDSFIWSAQFRDGTVINQTDCADRIESLYKLFSYIYGTESNKHRHYLKKFSLENNDTRYTVAFDSDGDAYLLLPGGRMSMTEYKIRSAELLYKRTRNDLTGDETYQIGFGGANTCDKMDGKIVEISGDGYNVYNVIM
jgi:hypothetical protein